MTVFRSILTSLKKAAAKRINIKIYFIKVLRLNNKYGIIRQDNKNERKNQNGR